MYNRLGKENNKTRLLRFGTFEYRDSLLNFVLMCACKRLVTPC